MWLILDIGNTSVKGGFFENGLLARTFRMASSRDASVPAYRHALRRHTEGLDLNGSDLERVGIVSVVPELTETLSEAVRLELMLLPEVVHTGMVSPLRLSYKTPQTLGADRLAAAVAARRLYGADEDGRSRHLLVIDAGTAVTYEVVDRRAVYRGGAIAPGPELARRALARGTSQLPEVPPELPRETVGRATREALQSGIMFGFIDGVSGMIERITSELRGDVFVVSTGGWGSFLREHVPTIYRYDGDLVLYGGQFLLEMNPPGGVPLADSEPAR